MSESQLWGLDRGRAEWIVWGVRRELGEIHLRKMIYLAAGFAFLVLAGAGVVLPVLPAAPFLIAAAYCFSRGDPRLERWLRNHPQYGPGISLWMDKGAISRNGKYMASIGFAGGFAIALFVLPKPWSYVSETIAVLGCAWVWTRPES